MSAAPSPQTTSHARMRVPLKCPSTRGRRNALVMTPSNSPHPPTSTALVSAPERRHDAHEQAIALLPVGAGDVKRNLDRSPHAVRPWNCDVRLRRREPARSDVHPLRVEPVPRVRRRPARAQSAAAGQTAPTACPAAPLRVSTLDRRHASEHRGPGGGCTTNCPSPFTPAENRPSGHVMRWRPAAPPANRMPPSSMTSANRACPRRCKSRRSWPSAGVFVPSGAMRYSNARSRRTRRDVALVTSKLRGSHRSRPRSDSKRYSFTPATALAKVPFSSRPPLNRWNVPVKTPSPLRRQRSRAKKSPASWESARGSAPARSAPATGRDRRPRSPASANRRRRGRAR